MFKDKLKKIIDGDGNNKKKIENIIFLVVILIITIIVINSILKGEKKDNKDNTTSTYKTLAETELSINNNENKSSNLQEQLETILSTIKGVGKVNVFLSYSESSKTVAMYDEKTTVSSTEESDTSGGTRNTTSTQTQKDVIYSEENGNQVPMTEKVIMPTIEGAVITAQGAKNANVKTNIVNAVKSATGLSIDKIQVFEMES